MELTLTKENEDGSADFDMKLTCVEVQQIIRFGLITLLEKAVKEGEKYEPSEFGMGDTESGTKDCVYGPCVKSGKSELNCICDQVTQVPY
jgi:hypothetical protein